MPVPDFLSSTRGRIVIALLRRHGSISDLAERLELGGGGVRQHVTALARDGLVEDFADQHTATRPAAVFRATSAAEDLFRDGGAFLLAAFLEQYVDEHVELDVFLANVADRLGAEHELAGDASHEERIEHAAGLFRDLGGLVEITRFDNGDVRLEGIVCPFGRLPCGQPGLCRLAAVMLERMTYVPVRGACDRGPGGRPRCRLHFELAPRATSPTPASP